MCVCGVSLLFLFFWFSLSEIWCQKICFFGLGCFDVLMGVFCFYCGSTSLKYGTTKCVRLRFCMFLVSFVFSSSYLPFFVFFMKKRGLTTVRSVLFLSLPDSSGHDNH